MDKKPNSLDKLKTIFKKFRSFFMSIYIKPGDILVYALAGLIAILLLGSIYSSINDISKYKILENEKQILSELESQNYDLQKTRNYYKSSFYRRLYARESLSLAKENQDIFYIDRSSETSIERPEENIDPIDLQNVRFWWFKLIF